MRTDADVAQPSASVRTLTHVAFVRSYGVGVERAKYIVATTYKYSKTYKIPAADMLALMAAESSFDINATSDKGAAGLVQHIDKWHPEKVEVVKAKLGYYSRYDIKANILMGILIAKEYKLRYGPKWLQAYNGALGDRTFKFTKTVRHLKAQIPT